MWQRLEALIDGGDAISSDEVRREIERKDDLLLAWCKPHAAMFLPLSADIQRAASAILAELPKLVDARTGKSMADPFVVATAQVTRTVLVTEERPTGKITAQRFLRHARVRA